MSHNLDMSLSLYGLISESESQFILDGVNSDCRSDGRTCNDFRIVEIEQETIATTNGSARVRIGATEILVGVKAELEKPELKTPNQGKLEFTVDCSPNATPIFEGRRGGESIEAEISQIFERFYKNEKVVDRNKLSVVKGKWCWEIYIDILVLELGGNLVDVCGIGIYSALKNTILPKIEIEKGDGEEVEIILSDDPLDGIELELFNINPILTVTIAKLGNRYICDPSDEEEIVSNVKLCVAINNEGSVSGMTKIGIGSLDPESIREILLISKKAGKVLTRSVNRFIKENDQNHNYDLPEDTARFL
jgi:exosome complex component RRP42